MRIHCLQHVPFEDPGSILDWAAVRGHRVTHTRLFRRGQEMPRPSDFDWLVVMGGPMGATDDAEYPWMAAEKHLIAEAIDGDRTVLGICLGAQLLADVLGARVYGNDETEIGWFPVTLTPAGGASPLTASLPREFEAFHWHGDTFDVPKGGVALASSAACRNQAFSVGDNVLGLQFHLEVTLAGARRLADACGDQLVRGRWVSSAEEMLADAERFVRAGRLMEGVLDALERATA